jgi:hypothetical protein
MQRVMILFMPAKYQPDYMYLRKVPVRRVHLFTLLQVICLAILWTIKSIKMISIVFPLMVLAMCFVRKALDWVFTRHELMWLDDIIPESHKRDKEDTMYAGGVSDSFHAMSPTLHSCATNTIRILDRSLTCSCTMSSSHSWRSVGHLCLAAGFPTRTPTGPLPGSSFQWIHPQSMCMCLCCGPLLRIYVV